MIGNFIKNISATELIIIGGIATLIFGRKFMMNIGKTAGETLREVKKVKTSFTEAVEGEEVSKEV